MKKLKSFALSILTQLKEIFKKFPVTIAIVYIMTIIFTLNIDNTFISAEIFSKIMFVAFLTGIGTLLVETAFENKNKFLKYAGVVLSLVIALIFNHILNDTDANLTIFSRCFFAYVITVLLVTFYINLKKFEGTFEKYYYNVWLNWSRTTTIYLMLCLGISILVIISSVLLFDDLGWDVTSRLLSLITGFYYIPSCILALVKQDVEDTKFNKTLVTKVIIPLVMISFVIIYLYIIKLFVTSELIHNSIFAILSAIFVCAFLGYMFGKNYAQESKLTEKSLKILPFLFIPFIFLQAYAMNLRVSDYGLTFSRYMGYVLIIFEIATVFLILFKEGKYFKELVLALTAIVLVIYISPINFDDACNSSQKKILEDFIEMNVDFEDLSSEEKSRYSSAYKYLKRHSDDDEYINENLTGKQIKELSSYWSNGSSESDPVKTDIFYLYREIDGLDISNYSKIYKMDSTYSRNNKDINNCIIETDIKLDVTCDLEDLFEKYIKQDMYENDIRYKFENEGVIKTKDENYDIYITRLEIEYKIDNGKVEFYSLDGYLLEK